MLALQQLASSWCVQVILVHLRVSAVGLKHPVAVADVSSCIAIWFAFNPGRVGLHDSTVVSAPLQLCLMDNSAKLRSLSLEFVTSILALVSDS